MKNLYISIFLSIFLFGCTSTSSFSPPQIIEKPIIIEKIKYPKYQKIDYPNNLVLRNFRWDYPRDSDKKVIIDSNIFIGLDEENYKILLENWNKLLLREKEWRGIIDLINKERELKKDIE